MRSRLFNWTSGQAFSAALIAFRASLAPVILWDALDANASPWFGWLFTIGMLSDVLDGEVLRRYRESSPLLRRLDSNADAAFYLSVLLGVWLTRPSVLQPFMPLILTLLMTQLCSWLLSLRKFGKLTSYHSLLAKGWALTIFVAILSLLLRPSEAVVALAIFTGFLSHAEDMAMTMVLPHWRVDVLSLAHALGVRRSEAYGSIAVPD